jgi:uncharacterized membrane protein
MKPFIVSLLALLAIDSVWLTVMAKKFYSQHIGHIMASSPNLVPAGAFYLVYSLGITFFVVTPAVHNNSSLTKVFLTGALLGLVAYATYDLTNHATIKNWPTIVTLVDLIWGALLTGAVSLIAFYVTKHY